MWWFFLQLTSQVVEHIGNSKAYVTAAGLFDYAGVDEASAIFLGVVGCDRHALGNIRDARRAVFVVCHRDEKCDVLVRQCGERRLAHIVFEIYF